MENKEYSKILLKEDAFLASFSEERNIHHIGPELIYRKLQVEDFDRGFCETLTNLTVVGHVTKQQFLDRFERMKIDKSDVYKVVVCVDKSTGQVIASGTVFFELKFIRNMGVWGHIEDIAVRKEYHGQNIGLHLIYCLKELSKMNYWYKIILDWRQELTKFYGKNGFKQKEIQMAWYNDDLLGDQQNKQVPPSAVGRL